MNPKLQQKQSTAKDATKINSKFILEHSVSLLNLPVGFVDGGQVVAKMFSFGYFI
jgi:hypothetical protein